MRPRFGKAQDFIDQIEDLCGQGLVIVRLEDVAVLARVDQLAHAADVRADGGAALAHALEDRIREGLRDRGEQVDVETGEVLVHRRNPAAERDAVGDAQLLRERAQSGLVLAVARDQQTELRALLARPGKAPDTGWEILDLREPGGDAAEDVVRCDLHAPQLTPLQSRNTRAVSTPRASTERAMRSATA